MDVQLGSLAAPPPFSLPVTGISCCARRRASTTTFPSQRRTTGTRSWGRNLRWDWSVNNPPWLSKVRLKTPAGSHTRFFKESCRCFYLFLSTTDFPKHLGVNGTEEQRNRWKQPNVRSYNVFLMSNSRFDAFVNILNQLRLVQGQTGYFFGFVAIVDRTSRDCDGSWGLG